MRVDLAFQRECDRTAMSGGSDVLIATTNGRRWKEQWEWIRASSVGARSNQGTTALSKNQKRTLKRRYGSWLIQMNSRYRASLVISGGCWVASTGSCRKRS